MPDLQTYANAIIEWEYFVPTYLALGFIIAVAILKWPDNASESPGPTLLMITFFWGPALLIFGPLFVIGLLLGGLCSLLGIEASEGDSHGT